MNQICDYDKEPVYYCPRCLSLRIRADIADYCYCDNCGSTNVETTGVFEWDEMYKKRYGFHFIDSTF